MQQKGKAAASKTKAPSRGSSRLPMGFSDRTGPGRSGINSRSERDTKSGAANSMRKVAGKDKNSRTETKSAAGGRDGMRTSAVKKKISAKVGKRESTSKKESDTSDAVSQSENISADIEEMKNENERLTSSLEAAADEMEKWKHESGNMQLRVRRTEKSLSDLQLQYDDDVSKLRQRISAMQDRVSLVRRLEAGILDLCLEVRDRSSDALETISDDSSARLLSDEDQKREILNQCGGDALVLLDLLRANIRIQLAFKEDYEVELKGTLDRRRDAHVQEIERLKDLQSATMQKLEAANDRIESLEHELRESSDDKARVARECDIIVESWRGKVVALEKKINQRDSSIEGLLSQAQDAAVEVRATKSLKLQVTQLENKILTLQKNQARARGKMRIAHRNELQRMEAQLQIMTRELSHRSVAEEECRKMRSELRSYQKNLKLVKLDAAEGRKDAALREASTLRDELAACKGRLRRANAKNDKQEKTIVKLKVEYQRLYKLMENNAEKKELGSGESTEKLSRKELRDLANQNPYVVDYFKDKLKASQKEVKNLKDNTRQWMISNHRKSSRLASVKAVVHKQQAEVVELKQEITGLRRRFLDEYGETSAETNQ